MKLIWCTSGIGLTDISEQLTLKMVHVCYSDLALGIDVNH